ncbi:hypothetical protein [Arthrobacter roseus]|uniref:hypothetical protein n=1 Tax=Arthrobacter roseus TaxID=136274 RepID=UPI003084123F|nr:hypothetical protein [Arthrobacter roseus]
MVVPRGQLEAADCAGFDEELLEESLVDDAPDGVFLDLSVLVDEDEESEEPEAGEEVLEVSRESLR